MTNLITFPIPTADECLEPAEEPFRSIYAYSHFVTIPIYILSIFLLLKEMSSEILKNYRKFLIWHTCGNLIFELFTTILMVPVTYLPFKAMRGTGILKNYKVSGIRQIYFLVIFSLHTSISILELFQCRLRAISTNLIPNRRFLLTFRIGFYASALFTVVFGFCIFPILNENQFELKRKYYLESLSPEYPPFPRAIFCVTSVVAPTLFDPIFALWWIVMTIAVVLTFLVFSTTFRTITSQLEIVAKHLSEKTLQMQRILLRSLIIQSMVHGIMLGVPVVGFSVCLIIQVDYRLIGNLLILLAAFHGSVSMITLISFTKPLRVGFVELVLKLKFWPGTKKATRVLAIDVSASVRVSSRVFGKLKMTNLITFPIPTADECLEPAEEPFRSIYAYSHFVTIPIYILSIFLLLKEMSSEILKNYRKFLIWHTCGNLIFELFTTILMVPVTYLPFKAMRGTGILKNYKVSGIRQIYFLVIFSLHTSISILELFQCRLRAISTNLIPNRRFLLTFRIGFYASALFTVVFGFCIFPILNENQFELKRKYYLESLSPEYPPFPRAIFCVTSVVAPTLFDPIFALWWIVMAIAVVLTFLVFSTTFRTITSQLEIVAKHLSEKTLQMQRILLRSLIIQSMVHGIMLGVPVVGFSVCMIIQVDKNLIAHLLILLAAFHGSVSTITLISFTKPLRVGFVELVLKLKFWPGKKKATRVLAIGVSPSVQPTTQLFG